MRHRATSVEFLVWGVGRSRCCQRSHFVPERIPCPSPRAGRAAVELNAPKWRQAPGGAGGGRYWPHLPAQRHDADNDKSCGRSPFSSQHKRVSSENRLVPPDNAPSRAWRKPGSPLRRWSRQGRDTPYSWPPRFLLYHESHELRHGPTALIFKSDKCLDPISLSNIGKKFSRCSVRSDSDRREQSNDPFRLYNCHRPLNEEGINVDVATPRSG